ncbi:MAG: hydrogenase iron-sulfur subunit [Candidatus Thermoplasmatota archaeon]
MKILAFLCNWCSYAGADLAGTSRLQYPADVRVIRVMCSGRVSPIFVLKAFAMGADAVIVAGCHPGDCHYMKGNLVARKRFGLLSSLLNFIGIDERRFRLEWISASEGKKFADFITEVVNSVEMVRSLDR